MLSDLYKFEGRIGRLSLIWKYIVSIVLFVVFIFAGTFILSAISSMLPPIVVMGLSFLGLTFIVVSVLIIGCGLVARRLHDIGISGWWQLLPAVIGMGLFAYELNQNPELLGLIFSGMSEEQILQAALNSGGEFSYATGIISSIINILFFLLLILWPGSKNENKYGAASGKFYNPMSNSKSGDVLRSAGQPRRYKVTFVQQIPEDSLYIMKHLSKSTREIIKINMPEDRMTADFTINGNTQYRESDVKKTLQELGIAVKSVVSVE